jgi:hypothetical protein
VSDHKINSLLSLGTIPAKTEDDRAALTRAIEMWVSGQTLAQWPRALQAFENTSFLLGNHVTRFMYDAGNGFGVSGGSVIGSAPGENLDNVPSTFDNRLPRAVESMVGLLTEIEPAPRVMPNSDSPEDEDASDLSEIVLNLVYERPLDMPALLREAATIGAIFDGAILETDYSETGERIEVPRLTFETQTNTITGDDEAVPVEDGTETVERRDENASVWTPLHITVDPGATRPSNLTWVARSTFEDVDAIRERLVQNAQRTEAQGYFLKADDEIAIIAGSNHPLYWYTRIQDLLASPQNSFGGGLAASLLNTQGALPNQTLFTVIDVKPTAAFPRGRTLVIAGGKLLYAGDARSWSEKYPWRWHPYAFWSWFQIPGKFFGMGMLSEIVPLQKRINSIDFLLQKNREFMAIGQWWIPKHTKVKLGMIGGLPGQQYEYTDVQGLGKPERVQNQALPSDLYEERQNLVSAIEYISGTGTLDDQVAQSAARAGVILDFLRNEKLRNKGPMLRNFEKFVEVASQNILIDLQLNLLAEDEDLTNRVKLAARDHSSLSIQTFTGASLRDHHAVTIDIASELRHSPEAAEQRATEFFQFAQGNVSPAERAGLLDAMRLSKFVKSEQNDSLQRARRMVARISTGMVEAFLPMDELDDASVMAPEFQRACLSDRFLDYPDEVKSALLKGFYFYNDIMKQEAQAQMMQDLMMQGLAPSQMIAKQTPKVVKSAAQAPPAAE